MSKGDGGSGMRDHEVPPQRPHSSANVGPSQGAAGARCGAMIAATERGKARKEYHA
ncbi:MAG TPA: hypothetical protein VGJ20_22170 [Xanthobacteraceae bacterium]|jgi:hypothetical protein